MINYIGVLIESEIQGEVSEWFKELVLKTSDPERDRGFESHLLRFNTPNIVVCFLNIYQIRLTQVYNWRNTQVVEGVRLESG